MALSSKKISDAVIAQLDSIGINSKVDGKPSHTARMIQIIVREMVDAIRTDAQVVTDVVTTGSPNAHTGKGAGKVL